MVSASTLHLPNFVVFAENPRLPRRGSKPRRLCKSFHSSKERLVREDGRQVMSFDESSSKLLTTMSWCMAFIKKLVKRFQMTVGRVVKLERQEMSSVIALVKDSSPDTSILTSSL